MDFTSDSPPQSALCALWLRSVLSGRSGTPCHQPPDVLSDNDIVRRQPSTTVSGVPLPCPVLAVLGVRPTVAHACAREYRFAAPLRLASLARRGASSRRRGCPPYPLPRYVGACLSLAPPSAAPRSARGGHILSNASFFGSRAASVRCSLRAGLTVKPSAVRHSVCMVGRDPRPIPHCGDYAQEVEPVKGFHSPAATSRPWRLPLTGSTSCAWARYGVSVGACRLRCAWRAFGGRLYLTVTAARWAAFFAFFRVFQLLFFKCSPFTVPFMGLCS